MTSFFGPGESGSSPFDEFLARFPGSAAADPDELAQRMHAQVV